jgi:hypothetical protein
MRRHGEPSVISVGTEHDPQKFLAGAPTYGILSAATAKSPAARKVSNFCHYRNKIRRGMAAVKPKGF